MARKSLRFKPSHKDVLRANDAAVRFLAAGRPVPHELLNNVAPKRERAVPKPSVEPTEQEIQRAILDYLRQDRRVAFVGRFNRGTISSSYTNAQGRTSESYVRFNTIRGFPDIHGCLKGGRALYVEVKRPGRKPTEDQADFLEQATKAGALAFVACSIDDVITALG